MTRRAGGGMWYENSCQEDPQSFFLKMLYPPQDMLLKIFLCHTSYRGQT